MALQHLLDLLLFRLCLSTQERLFHITTVSPSLSDEDDSDEDEDGDDDALELTFTVTVVCPDASIKTCSVTSACTSVGMTWLEILCRFPGALFDLGFAGCAGCAFLFRGECVKPKASLPLYLGSACFSADKSNTLRWWQSP